MQFETYKIILHVCCYNKSQTKKIFYIVKLGLVLPSGDGLTLSRLRRDKLRSVRVGSFLLVHDRQGLVDKGSNEEFKPCQKMTSGFNLFGRSSINDVWSKPRNFGINTLTIPSIPYNYATSNLVVFSFLKCPFIPYYLYQTVKYS